MLTEIRIRDQKSSVGNPGCAIPEFLNKFFPIINKMYFMKLSEKFFEYQNYLKILVKNLRREDKCYKCKDH